MSEAYNALSGFLAALVPLNSESDMTFHIGLIILNFAVALMGSALVAYHVRVGQKLAALMWVAVTLLNITGVVSGLYRLGAGNVAATAHDWDDQLSSGSAYTVLGQAHDQKDDVLLVRKDGTSDFYTVRVKADQVPQHFVLVDGHPVAVATK